MSGVAMVETTSYSFKPWILHGIKLSTNFDNLIYRYTSVLVDKNIQSNHRTVPNTVTGHFE